MVNARRPHFLEVFLPNLSSERLKIPSNFIKHLKGRTSGPVSLIGPSGNSWHVHLIELNGHLYLDDGWHVFVRDHSIECGDSLVFGYDGNMSFAVQIFDQTSCEKEETFYAKCSQELSDLSRFSENKITEGETSFSSMFDEKRMRVSSIPTHVDLKIGTNSELEKSRGEDQEHMESLRNNCDDNTQDLVEPFKRPILLALPAIANCEMLPSLMNHQRIRKALKPMKAWSKKKKAGTQKKSSISKFIEARAAHYFTSTFPYFVRVMKYSNVNDRSTLKIPVRFSMEHFPDCRIGVTLRNLNGDYWMINAVPSRKTHSVMHTFSAGWLAFVRDNRIKQEDVCIFELVAKFEMRVHILRLGLEGVDSETQKSSLDGCGVGIDVETDGLPLISTEIILQDNDVHPLKILEKTNEPSINDIEEHDKVSEMIPGHEQETESSSDTSDDATMLTSPFNISPLQMSRTQHKSKDQLRRCNAEGGVSYQTSRKTEADLHARCTTQVPVAGEDGGAPLSFTSPFPNFMKVMMSSNVGGSFTLGIPKKFSAQYLPSYKTEIVLRNLKGDCWLVTSGLYGHQTKFSGGWMSFVRQNDVKIGDICVFELLDEGVFQVQVLQSSQRVQERSSNAAAADDDSSVSVEST